METLYATGIRHAEAHRLDLYDVDTAAHRLTVRLGKGQRDRLVPFTETAAHWLARYLTVARPDSRERCQLWWPTVQVFTRLDQAPAVGRTLHMAYEQAGTRAAGQLFQGHIPKGLVEQLKRSGLAFEKTLQWQGAAGAAKTYTELQIMPQAARFIIPFLK